MTSPTTLPAWLAAGSASHPDRAFLRTPGREITYGEASHAVASVAAGLHAAGVRPGDRVVLLMSNSIEQVIAWYALGHIGAISVPLNCALTDALLRRSIDLVSPVAFVVDAEFALRLVHVNSQAPSPVFVVGGDAPAGTVVWSTLFDHGEREAVPVDPLATAVMLFTSGSTGVPKACALSHHYTVRQGCIHRDRLKLRADDVLVSPFPLFHIDAATLTVGAATVTGATAGISPRFSASIFWDEVREYDGTIFNYMGATATILWKQPPDPRDREHRMRLGWGVPMPTFAEEWRERFGFGLLEVYGLTDAGLPAYTPIDEPAPAGACGRVIDEFEVSIQDEFGTSLPLGADGEICIRSDEPGLLMTEYYGMPELTAHAFRGGWFHTGDVGRLDSDGWLSFVGRSSEVIRRRGENIAATDVESGVNSHPDVVESAAFGVPSELTDDDVKVCVVLRDGSTLAPAELIAHCRTTLPRHMVPRYVEFVESLPKTATEKIERRVLAEMTLTATTWDAERSAWCAASAGEF